MYLCFPLRSNLYLSNMNVYSYVGTGHKQLWWNLFYGLRLYVVFEPFYGTDRVIKYCLHQPILLIIGLFSIKAKKLICFFFTKCKYYFLDVPQILTSPHVPAPRAHRTRPFFRHISALVRITLIVIYLWQRWLQSHFLIVLVQNCIFCPL